MRGAGRILIEEPIHSVSCSLECWLVRLGGSPERGPRVGPREILPFA
jgi:hypothetical protein